MAPKITALMRPPDFSATCAMSNAMKRAAALAAAVRNSPLLTRPVAQRGFLADGVFAVRGGDQRGAVGRDQSAVQCASRLHQFRGHDDVDIARARHERHHGLAAVGAQRSFGKEFQVIDGGAGALRDTGNRGGLCDETGAARGQHQPVGDHSAALTAERGDAEGDGADGGAHSATPSGAGLPLSRRITAERRPWMKRSHGLGLTMTSAR